MGMNQTKMWLLNRQNRLYEGIGQTEILKNITRPNRPKIVCWPERTDRNTGINQTKQTEKSVDQTEPPEI